MITNLTGPASVAIDNHESLIIISQTTIEGGNYHRYDIYKQDGIQVGNIRDNNDISILSNTFETTSMFIDGFNNLYFYHEDRILFNGYVTNDDVFNNPQGNGIFK